MHGGYIPRRKKAMDKRFSLTRNFGSPSLDIPARFSIKDAKGDINGSRDQYYNCCTAATTSEIGADEWGIAMSQEFQAMAISLIQGKKLYLDGADIDHALKSGRQYGFLPAKQLPTNMVGATIDFICDPANWPQDIFVQAGAYKIPGGDFVVDGPYDSFNNHRAQLYQHKPDNGISAGIPWYSSFTFSSGGVVKDLNGSVSWHDIEVEGWEEINGVPHMKIRSWGKSVGDATGHFYFPEDIFNTITGTPGAVSKMYKQIDENLVEDTASRDLSAFESMLDLYYWLLFKYQTLLALKS